MSKVPKERLDILAHQQSPEYSRKQIQGWIMQGRVTVDGVVQTKVGMQIPSDAIIVLNVEQPKYASRAGFKLEKALDTFGIDVHDYVAMDAGLSTGGFTDCLLQRGVRKVYGIDVGYGQVVDKIRYDDRVLVMERTNLREVRELPELVDIVTLDLSFISVLKVMDAVSAVLKPGGKLVVLIKPQFEAGRYEVGRGGIVKDEAVHERVVEKVTTGIVEHGFAFKAVTESPILGTHGNKEFLAYFEKKPLEAEKPR